MSEPNRSASSKEAQGEKVSIEKPNAIVFKVLGVLVPYSFGEVKLIKYSIENCSQFLDGHLFSSKVLKLLPKIKKSYDSIVAGNAKCPSVSFDRFFRILNIEDEAQRRKEIESNREAIKEFKSKLTAFLVFVFNDSSQSSSESPANEIQNLIWQEGYSTNRLKSEFYVDAPAKLKEWKEMNIRLFTLSSGTVVAQQITLQNSLAGNLLAFLDGEICSAKLDKKSTSCYTRIAEIVNEDKKSILFVSGSLSEVKAASICGLKTCLLLRREKSTDFDESVYREVIDVAHDLNQIEFN